MIFSRCCTKSNREIKCFCQETNAKQAFGGEAPKTSCRRMANQPWNDTRAAHIPGEHEGGDKKETSRSTPQKIETREQIS